MGGGGGGRPPPLTNSVRLLEAGGGGRPSPKKTKVLCPAVWVGFAAPPPPPAQRSIVLGPPEGRGKGSSSYIINAHIHINESKRIRRMRGMKISAIGECAQ